MEVFVCYYNKSYFGQHLALWQLFADRNHLWHLSIYYIRRVLKKCQNYWLVTTARSNQRQVFSRSLGFPLTICYSLLNLDSRWFRVPSLDKIEGSATTLVQLAHHGLANAASFGFNLHFTTCWSEAFASRQFAYIGWLKACSCRSSVNLAFPTTIWWPFRWSWFASAGTDSTNSFD